MEKKSYNLRVFSYGYEFMQALKEEFRKRGNLYQYRWSAHPLNGQIDIQPIPHWYYPTISGLVNNYSKRRLYLAISIEPYSPYESYSFVVNLALDLNEQKLGVLGTMRTRGRDINVLADTTNVTIGTERLVSIRILEKIRKFMDMKGFGEIKPQTMLNDVDLVKKAAEEREKFFRTLT